MSTFRHCLTVDRNRMSSCCAFSGRVIRVHSKGAEWPNPARRIPKLEMLTASKAKEEKSEGKKIFPRISLTDLFSVEELQKIQDAFAIATHVASIITLPDGTPVCNYSNFCRLCNDIVRKTEKGRMNCFHSDSIIGRQNDQGPIIQICMSGGLWDAGASITVGGQHVGNWLIGQVKNELNDEAQMLRYAREIGADEEEFRQALQEVPTMSLEQFKEIANLVFIFANQLSQRAYQNLQQSLHIAERKQAEIALRESQERLKLLLDVNNAVVSKLDLGELFHLIPASVRHAMQCDSVCMSMPDADARRFRIRGLDFPTSNGFLREGVVMEIEGSGPGIAFATGKPYRYGNPPEGPNPHVQSINRSEGFHSGCFIPVRGAGRTLAVLHLSDRRKEFFSEHDMNFLTQVARQVAIAMENALQYQQLSRSSERLVGENLYLTNEIQASQEAEHILGDSHSIRKAIELIANVAKTDSTVLIRGETGTGKELVAREIHNRSRRRDMMFVKMSCAAIPATLLESELFGHEKGAFTGATTRKIGRFELANGGTLFLDEVGDIPPELQPKLLRVLQEQEFERLGSTRPIKVDVRLVAATNRDLESMMLDNQFRADLFYRLNVFPIHLPSLRERTEDIPLLVRHFVAEYTRKMHRKIEEIPASVMEQLTRYHWPGNIREMQNLIQRAVILSPGNILLSPFAELGQAKLPPTEKPARQPQPRGTLFEMERNHIEQILHETNWVLSGRDGAASRLGIPRTTLLYRMKRLGIPRQQA
ncbi:MAG: sigma 54-interacting transcriptional regulator [Terracidiphilus sp.]